MRGFPIRTSSDHGSFANSPRLIAGYNVLLRLLVPRHPPCALINLTTKIIQKDARVHCAVLKLRPEQAPSPQRLPPPRCISTSAQAVRPGGTSPQPPAPAPHPQVRTACAATPTKQPSGCSLRTQQRARPTLNPSSHRSHPTRKGRRTRRHQLDEPATVDVPPSSTVPHSFGRDNGPGHPPPPMTGECGCQMLLRKEVIQPHLPVRLPCYDLVPIASPTFDSSLHKGWATGFGCYRLS